MLVRIPNILADAIGQRVINVQAATVREAIEQLRVHPKLGPLLFDESKALRRHVILFVNDTSTRHMPSLDVPIAEGDQLSIVQSVSGG